MRQQMLLIVNRASRQGQKDLEPALAVFRLSGIECLRVEGGTAEQVARAIADRGDEVEGVVVGGGDGTLQGVLPALKESGLPLGILPMGTANDFAGALGVPLDLAEAARVIVAGNKRRIDVASANGVLYFNVAHIGLGARVNARLTGEVKQQWGRWSYLRTLIASLGELRSFGVVLEYGDTRLQFRSIQVSVGNGGQYGGGMKISEAALDDSLLHVSSVSPASLWRLIGLFLRLRAGLAGGNGEVRLYHLAEVIVRTRRRMRVTAGGEWVTETPVHFQVLPQAVEVYVKGVEKT